MRRTRPFLFDRSTQGAAVSRRWRRGCAAGLVALAAAFATVQSADAQQCQRAVNVIRPTAVFSHPANSFNLASGWVYGQPVAELRPGVKVHDCGERTVNFGAVQLQWSHIAYWAEGRWNYGWVVAENLQLGQAGGAGATAFALRMLPIAGADAQTLPTRTLPVAETAPPTSTSPGPPPADAPPAGTAAPVATQSSWSPALVKFYAVLFIFMVLGMLGKVGFDRLGGNGARDGSPLRACVLPLLISPMTFLGILQASNATASADIGSFLAVVCTAFQSGFFWYTVCDPSKRGAPEPGAEWVRAANGLAGPSRVA